MVVPYDIPIKFDLIYNLYCSLLPGYDKTKTFREFCTVYIQCLMLSTVWFAQNLSDVINMEYHLSNQMTKHKG